MNSFDDAVNLLTSSGKFRINLGLERISAILNLLHNPQDTLKCIHVAGTNGKGSTCAIIASILKTAGYKIGLYTSPHIFSYTERIKINDVQISKEVFANLIFEICKLAENNGIELTEFEILTALMFKYFADEKVDVVILETGLGGRFDATNVIKSNLCSIITHIDYDHTERLGNTLEEIAGEKAGIIKKNCPVVTCEGFEIIRDTADRLDSLLIMTSPYSAQDMVSSLNLKGLVQGENLALALTCIQYLFKNIDSGVIQKGLMEVRHPCRFQYLPDKNMIIDASHNPNGVEALRASLDYYFPDKKLRFIFGCLKNKDYPQMIRRLLKKEDEIYFYKFNNPNSCSVKELMAAYEFPAKEFLGFDKLNLRDDKLTVVCGSFYMLNELIKPEWID